jgi:hypothetical protein
VFRAITTGALDELKTILGDALALVLETIESHIQYFFVEYVLTTQDFFDLDYIGICLVDAKGELENYLSEGGFDINN